MNKKILISVLLCVALISSCVIPAYAITVNRTLSRGMEGDDVLYVQGLLAGLEYYGGALDGKFGYGMKAAVDSFQRQNALTVNGQVNEETLALLESGTAVPDDFDNMKLGDSGDMVKSVQENLADTYYYRGSADGVFDIEVYRAVKSFQASASLKADGVVGEQTYNALEGRTSAIFNGGLPVRTLSQGSSGYDVYVLQLRLKDLNYLIIDATGLFAADTQAAVKSFQAANSLKQTGVVDAKLRRYLWPVEVDAGDAAAARTLRLGSHGKDVAAMQMRLKAAGYLMANADGIFGVATKNAVMALQKNYGLKVDGVAGAVTLAVINTFDITAADPVVVVDGYEAVVLPTSSLRSGMKGAAVKQLQQYLITLNLLDAGKDDGIFGPLTKAAVITLQKLAGLTRDGVVGTKTWVIIRALLS
jgi:peptidoglycan hydrolase-like protein with peptidoglycan-binding domain